MRDMSSRERMLAAITCQNQVAPPCSFMLFKGLQMATQDYAEFIRKQVDMGLDAYVMLPPRNPRLMTDTYNLHGLPVHFADEVEIREWEERREQERFPVLVKEYHTPAGVLRTEVRRTPDWRWGKHIPFLDDFITSRAISFPVKCEDDLPALQYLLTPPNDEEIADLHEESAHLQALARELDLLVAGGWGVGADMLGWIYGLERMMYAAYDTPDFLEALLKMIEQWNRERMIALLEMGIDLYIKRAWYETSHFWTPAAFRRFLLPVLKRDAALAHDYGVKFGYIVTAGTMPLLDMYAEAGVDVLIGVDPHEWDLRQTAQVLGGKVCLWGGVNGHLTVERGTVDDVRREVIEAMRILAPTRGFILSPVDNVREYNEQVMTNLEALLGAWQEFGSQHYG